MTTTNPNKKLVEQLFNEVMNGQNLSFLDKALAPNFKHHGGPPDEKPGINGFKETLQQFFIAFPDMKVNPEQFIAEDTTVVSRGTITGTNKGSFMGGPSTGKKFRVDYIDIWKVNDNGKFTENWVSIDMTALAVQLGLTTAHETAL